MALAVVDAPLRRDRTSMLHGHRSFVLIQLRRIWEAYQAAEAALQWADSDRARGLALCRMATLHSVTGRLDDARPLAQQALEIADALDDEELEVHAHLALAEAEPLVGPQERSGSLLIAAWRGALALGDADLIGRVGASFSAVLGNCGRFEESAAFAREAIAVCGVSPRGRIGSKRECSRTTARRPCSHLVVGTRQPRSWTRLRLGTDSVSPASVVPSSMSRGATSRPPNGTSRWYAICSAVIRRTRA